MLPSSTVSSGKFGDDPLDGSHTPWIAFGPFRLSISERRLLKDGSPVRLGSRALDILIVLVQNVGVVVPKGELIKRVWHDLFVDEGSLRVHISALRKALGDGQSGVCYVKNVTGRGYSFVGSGMPHHDGGATSQSRSNGTCFERPRSLLRMVGRDVEANAIAGILAAHRFVTIHGPGGVGKTTIAETVAGRCMSAYPDGTIFLDLSAVPPSGDTSQVLAAALGLAAAGESTDNAVDYLRNRQILLVLDGCERLAYSVALLAERLVREAPNVSILATSREALRVERERIYPLAPLSAPQAGTCVGVADLSRHPATALFIEQAVSTGMPETLTDADAEVVAEICRKVDGLPLALEFVAAHSSMFGLRETARLLDGRLKLFWPGRRTAPPRHQTLNASVAWSYDLIDEQERTVLRQLSILDGSFTLTDARAAVGGRDLGGRAIIEILAQLVENSLVCVDARAPVTRYWLMAIVRAYAKARLDESHREHEPGLHPSPPRWEPGANGHGFTWAVGEIPHDRR